MAEFDSLIEANAAGNRAEFSALYDPAAPQLFGLAPGMLKSWNRGFQRLKGCFES